MKYRFFKLFAFNLYIHLEGSENLSGVIEDFVPRRFTQILFRFELSELSRYIIGYEQFSAYETLKRRNISTFGTQNCLEKSNDTPKEILFHPPVEN